MRNSRKKRGFLCFIRVSGLEYGIPRREVIAFEKSGYDFAALNDEVRVRLLGIILKYNE